MSSNPFQSPDAELHSEPELVGIEPIFSAKHVGFATYLGSPAAGGLLLWLNLRKEQTERSMVVAVVSILIMVASTLFAFYGPDASAPARGINMGLAWGYYAWAKKQSMSEELRLGRREQHSWWRVVGLSLLCVVAYIALMIPLVMVIDPEAAHEIMELVREL